MLTLLRQSPYRAEDGLLVWLLLGLFFSLPPLFCAGLLVALLAFPWLPAAWRARRHSLTLAGLTAGILLALLTLPNWLSGDSLLALLALVALLKRLELDSQRDRLLLVLVVLVCTSLNLVYWNNLPALLHLLGLMLLTLLLLRYRSGHLHFGSSAALLGWAMPLALALFLLLPRIPGPLWDLGLAFGMPLQLYQQSLSLSPATPQPGNDPLAALKAQQRIVLVAEFSGAVPLKSSLYWRGAVSYRQQDGDWLDSLEGSSRAQRLAAAYRDSNAWQALLDSPAAAVSYRIKVAPHQQYWLYAPGLAERNVQESYISADGQLLSIRPLQEEFSYQGSSYLDAALQTPAPALTPAPLPQADAAALQAILHDWQQTAQTQTAVEQLLALLASPPAWWQVQPPFSSDRLQRWVGYSVLLLQHAGVPARMVSGYRGGDLIALTDAIVVREKHRHHWLEYWQEGQGWQRLEVKDILQLRQALADKPASAPAASNAAAKQPASEEKPAPRPQSKDKGPGLWQQLEQWLQQYGRPAVAEEEAANNSGGDSGQQLTLWLAGLLGIWLLILALQTRNRQRPAPLQQAQQLLLQTLARQGFSLQPWQCPSHLCAALQQQSPPWGEAAQRLLTRWLQLQYGKAGPQDDAAALLAQVKRFHLALRQLPPAPAIPQAPSTKACTETL